MEFRTPGSPVGPSLGGGEHLAIRDPLSSLWPQAEVAQIAGTQPPTKREYSFGIRRGDRVLDVGCGARPFPLATYLADRTLHDHSERFDMPIPLDSRPFIECSVEALPFQDKSFDFVYCTHTLEHVRDPANACRELMRVGRRGYIECPRSWVEFVSGSDEHRWLVDHECDALIFREKMPEENRDFVGLRTRMLRWMHDPRFVAYWNSRKIRAVRNVEFSWVGSFAVRVLTRYERTHACSQARARAWIAMWNRRRTPADTGRKAAEEVLQLLRRPRGTRP